jgi:hypothetical protein
MDNYFRKSKPCKNCGEWVFEKEGMFNLETKIKNLYDYVKNSKTIPETEKEYLLKNLWEAR